MEYSNIYLENGKTMERLKHPIQGIMRSLHKLKEKEESWHKHRSRSPFL
jgi:hypothetical protein